MSGESRSSESGGPAKVITVDAPDLVEVTRSLLDAGHRLALVAAHDDGAAFRVVYVFTGAGVQRTELVLAVDRRRPRVPSLASVSFAASRFEREMRDLFGIEPLDHPQPRRLVLHQHWPENWFPMRRDAGEAPAMLDEAASYPFIPVEGPGVYEIPVGPVHAGLIEPGHFRFFVVGETILRMRARLWFVHKGIERLLQGTTVDEAMQIAQRISGDSAVGHGLAFTMAVEEALGVDVSDDHRRNRAALLEMERLYNHVADLGALCNDVAYSIGNALALSARERLLRMNAEVTGHRLLRDGVVLGASRVRRLATPGELDSLESDLERLVEMVRSNALVLDRFAGTAVLGHEDALAMGTLGVVARASGLDNDARATHPFVDMPDAFVTSSESAGDVLARFNVRVRECAVSIALLREWSRDVGAAPAGAPVLAPRAVDAFARSGVGIVEGFRGTIVHRIEIDGEGRLTRVKIVDPSFFNWPALPISLADTIIPDFPLANKSFNLSYAGNDL